MESAPRTLEASDLGSLTALCDRALDHDALAPAALAGVLEIPDQDGRVLGLGMWEGADLRGALLATVPRHVAEPVGNIQLVAIDPQVRERGYGRALVQEAEAWLAAQGVRNVRAAGAPPRYLWPGIDIRYTPALGLFRALGYERVGDAVNMLATLSDAALDSVAEEAQLAAQGIEVRRLEQADRDAFGRWMERWEAGWKPEVLRSLEHSPATCHVALSEEGFLGFAAHSGNRHGWFGPMATVPETRGSGIGRVLLRRCLADLRASGLETADIVWAGPLHFYSRAVGATAYRAFWQFGKSLEP